MVVIGVYVLSRSWREESERWKILVVFGFFFFFQAEDGIRDVERSRGLGDVYKRRTTGVSAA